MDPQEVNKSIVGAAKGAFSCVPAFFALIGLFMFLGGFPALLNSINLQFSGLHAVGTVTKVRVETHQYSNKRGTQTSTITTPDIEFTTNQNVKIRVPMNMQTDAVKFEEGQQVDVLYLEKEPQKAVVNHYEYL